MKHESCPIAKVSKIIADPCTVIILRDLIKQKMRFTDMLSDSQSSSRTLTIKLNKLVDIGLISKCDEGYSITKKGSNFKKIIDAMAEVGEVL